MRQIFDGILVVMCVCVLGSVLVAENQMGIADKYQVSFSEKVWVAIAGIGRIGLAKG